MGIWGHRVLRWVAALALALLLLLALVQSFILTRMAGDVPPLFRVVDLPGAENSLGAIDLARFAVSQHNNKTNARLELEKVLKVKQQLVVGTLYYITIQVNEGGAKKLYEAKVVVQPWLDFNSKQLVEFKQNDYILCTSQLCKDLADMAIVFSVLSWCNIKNKLNMRNVALGIGTKPTSFSNLCNAWFKSFFSGRDRKFLYTWSNLQKSALQRLL